MTAHTMENFAGNLSYVSLATLHSLSWSIYAGGSICMEFVLRHAQQYMKPSQVAVVCERSGKRYRWVSLICLIVLMLTGIPMLLMTEAPLTGGAQLLVSALVSMWLVQMLLLGILSFRFHPDMHMRVSATKNADEIATERRRVAIAILRMDLTVRIELLTIVAGLALGAALHLSL